MYPAHAHQPGAWQPGAWQPAAVAAAGARGGGGGGGAGVEHAEWVELAFKDPMYVSIIEVYETCHPGALTAILLWAGEAHGWEVVWRGEPQQALLPTEARLFAPPLEAKPYATRFVRLEMRISPSPPHSQQLAHSQQLVTQIDAVRVLGLKATSDAEPPGTPPSASKTGGARDGARDGAPSSSSSAPSTGGVVGGPPRHVQEQHERRPERHVQEQHEREVAQLQEYIRTLRTNYEGMRAALDAKTLELDKAQRLIRTSGAQDEPYTLPPGELPPAAPAAGAQKPKNVTFNVLDAVQFS